MRDWLLLASLVVGLACASCAGSAPAGGGAAGGIAPGGTSGTAGNGGGSGGARGGATAGSGGGATGGIAATGGSGNGGRGGATSAGASVLERNNHPSRDGHFLQPTLSKTAAAKMALDATFAATYTGAVMGDPLYFNGGAGGTSIFVAVTTSNDVYAFDETTGATVWTKNLGTPASKSGVPSCDGGNPLGVISTPVIDAGTATLYVAGGAGRRERHHVAFRVGLEPGGRKHQERIPGGRLRGPRLRSEAAQPARRAIDGGAHRLRAVRGPLGRLRRRHARQGRRDRHATSPPTVNGWQTAGQGEAIWAPGGMASAGDGVFAVTGNRLTSTGDHMDSEEVVHVRGMGTLDKTSGSKDFFFPSDWKTKDQRDFDLGAVNPVLVSLPGSSGPALIIASKDGNGFILDSADLGKGPLVSFDVTMQGMNVRSVPTAYLSGSTTFYAIAVDGAWVACPGGTGNGAALMAFALAPSLPLKPSVTWCAAYSLVPKGSDEGMRWGAPAAPGLISTTTDGTSDALVWYMDGGNQLVALDGATGTTVFRDTAASCGAVRKWTSPIAVNGRIVVAADGKLCSWSPQQWCP